MAQERNCALIADMIIIIYIIFFFFAVKCTVMRSVKAIEIKIKQQQ